MGALFWSARRTCRRLKESLPPERPRHSLSPSSIMLHSRTHCPTSFIIFFGGATTAGFLPLVAATGAAGTGAVEQVPRRQLLSPLGSDATAAEAAAAAEEEDEEAEEEEEEAVEEATADAET